MNQRKLTKTEIETIELFLNGRVLAAKEMVEAGEKGSKMMLAVAEDELELFRLAVLENR